MIIGVNGYIGSGKDTVGKIIQWITTEPNYTLEEFLKVENFYLLSTDWQIKKYAAKLKQIASLLTGIPVEKFEDQEFKKTDLGEEWSYFPEDADMDQILLWGKVGMTVREFLQKLGTEAIRDGLHPNTWVNALMSEYVAEDTWINNSAGAPTKLVKSSSKWIITDCRFPNEAQAIKDKGGIVIRVNRDLPQVEYQTLEQRHPSETSLDNWNFDYIIDNDDSLEELVEKVKECLKKFNIL